MNKPKILNIAPLGSAAGKYGGPYETSLAQVELLRGEFEGILFAPHIKGDEPDKNAIDGELISPKIRQITGAKNFLVTFSWASAMQAIARIKESDLVHLSFARESFPVFCAIACIVMKKKMIIQTHGMLTSRTSLAHRLIDRIIIPIFSSAHSVVALTDKEKLELMNWSGLKDSKIFVIGNPTRDLSEQHQSTDAFEEGGVSFIARLHKRKRVVDFAEAAHLAKAAGASTIFKVAGPDQGDLSELLPYVARKDIEYIGALNQSQVLQALAESKVFVLCSENEPWGNVLVSALKLGVPVVVTESCHLSSYINKYGAGIVVADKAPVQLAAGISSILKLNHRQYSDLSKRARDLAGEEFSNKVIGNHLRILYATAIAHI